MQVDTSETGVAIPLRAKDGTIRAYALVDAQDAEWARQWVWLLHSKQYAYRYIRVEGKRLRGRYKQQHVFLHRELLGLPHAFDGRVGDHINRTPLDNRRANLRVVTPTQNKQNRGALRGSTSRFRGVCWDARARRWRALVKVNDKTHCAGYFTTEQAAAEAASALRASLMTGAIEPSALAAVAA